MNTKIIYASKKNTKKVAMAIGEAIGVKPVEISLAGALKNVDVLFLAFGIYGGEPTQQVKNFVEKLESSMVKKVVLITTSGFGKDQTAELKKAISKKGIKVENKVFCGLGSFMIFKNFKQPNEKTINEAIKFAKGFIK